MPALGNSERTPLDLLGVYGWRRDLLIGVIGSLLSSLILAFATRWSFSTLVGRTLDRSSGAAVMVIIAHLIIAGFLAGLGMSGIRLVLSDMPETRGTPWSYFFVGIAVLALAALGGSFWVLWRVYSAGVS